MRWQGARAENHRAATNFPLQDYPMKIALALIPLLAALPALGHQVVPHEHEIVFTRASQLVPWCRQQAEAHYLARGIPTYQWTASYHDRGNLLHVQGQLRADGRYVQVSCRVARGARERYATIEILEP